jgi:tetratricopeptide (TPR) repeat protein
MVALAVRAGSPELALQGRNWMVVDLLELGRRADAEEAIDRYEADATAVRLPRYRWYVPLWRAMLADLSGDFAAGEVHRREAVEEGGLAQDPNADLFAFVQHFQALLDSWRIDGPRWDEAREEVMRRRARSPVPDAWTTWLPAQLALIGRTEEARQWMDVIAADDFAAIPADANWHVVCEVAEGAALLGDAGRAAAVHERMAPHARLYPVVARGVACFGTVEYFLARTAATLGAVEEAEERFVRATERNESLGARPRLAATLLRHAELVAAAGDAGRARDLAGRALAEAEALGMDLLARSAEAVRAGLSPPRPS